MKKTCAGLLSLCLSILAALTPAAQAAQFAAEGASIRAVALPSAPLTPSLPSLPGSLPSSLTLSNPGLIPTAADAASAISAPKAVSAAPAAVSAAAAPVAPAASAQAALRQAGRALSEGASKNPEGALNPLFENAGRRDDCGGSCGGLYERVDDAPPSALQPASVRPEADLAGRGAPQGPQSPKTSFARSAKVGLIGAVTMLAVNIVVSALASLAHYGFHPGYHDPTPQHLTLAVATVFLSVLSVFAPVAEEVMFRYGLMGVVRKLTFNKSKFIVPAVLSSIIFTAVHEMRDPLIFGIRFIGAMILARIYHKEGIAASMATHGIYNGLPFLPIMASLAFGPAIGNLFGIALVPAALYYAWKFHKQLRAEAPAREAGRIAPFQITRGMAFGLAFFLLLGFLYVIHTPVWLGGLLAWLVYAGRHKTAKK